MERTDADRAVTEVAARSRAVGTSGAIVARSHRLGSRDVMVAVAMNLLLGCNIIAIKLAVDAIAPLTAALLRMLIFGRSAGPPFVSFAGRCLGWSLSET